jgi:vacuolar iron transporter family protein
MTEQQATPLDQATITALLAAQKNELTEAIIYDKLADKMKDEHNENILRQIAVDERAHYDFYRTFTGQDVKPSRRKIWWFYILARVLGLTFSLKLMERGEAGAQIAYERIEAHVPGMRNIIQDEDKHEHELIDMLDEDLLKYVGSIVLGLSDALVELTGALAGFTFALGNTTLIAMAGLITGIAASLSMGASEYLSTKAEGGENPLRSSIYTGIAYVFTVAFLIAPYLILDNLYVCLAVALTNAIIVILVFTFYISVAKDLSFKVRFGEMAGISLSVALITFGIGFVIRHFLGIEV